MSRWQQNTRRDKLSLRQKMDESSQNWGDLRNETFEREEITFTRSLEDYVLRRDNSGKAVRIYPVRTTRPSKAEAVIAAS